MRLGKREAEARRNQASVQFIQVSPLHDPINLSPISNNLLFCPEVSFSELKLLMVFSFQIPWPLFGQTVLLGRVLGLSQERHQH